MLLTHFQESIWMLLWEQVLCVSRAQAACLAAGRGRSASKFWCGWFGLVFPILCQYFCGCHPDTVRCLNDDRSKYG